MPAVNEWSRRAVLSAAVGGAGLATATTPGRSITSEGTTVVATPIATGFTAPVDVAVPPNRPSRIYVVDQDGVVFRVDEGAVTGDPFLDLRDAIVPVSGYDERGLLGLALHPSFDSNRRFYVRYSAPPRAGTPDGYDHTFVLSEFEATADGTGVIDGSERTLLEIPEPQMNHNAGSLAFGPDGYLYVGVGDGGAAGDQGLGHVNDWYEAVEGGNGQDVIANLLGSILRIDPDDRSGDRPYGIPSDNPLVGREGVAEQYAWGFRNPWRFSFDGSDFYVADVGQNHYEEVNRVKKGGNYGWNVREGTHCYAASDCPTTTPDGTPLRRPIIEYSHAADADPRGQAVIGGYRYRGSDLDGLTGAYLFTDWAADGRLFVARPPDDDGLWPISVASLESTGTPIGRFVLAFGRTPDDELLVCTTDEAAVTGNSGGLFRLSDVQSASPTTDTTTTDGQPGMGVAAAILGLGGGIAYALARHRDR
ncbi:MAG: sorbosone dehydrogenase family protein [Halobacteriaceae archaeon]